MLPSVAELTVLDLGSGMPAALLAKVFGELGADLVRIDSGAEAAFREMYEAWGAWRLRGRQAEVADLVAEVLAADVCIIGGEDHPDVRVRPEAARLLELNPRLVVVDLTAYAGLAPQRGPAVDLLVQTRTGFVTEHAPEPRASAVQFGVYGAVALGLTGAFAALLARERTGRGQVVRTSMQQGLAMLWSQLWQSVERPGPRTNVVAPLDVQHLIFECLDGESIHITMGVPGAVSKVYRILGIDADVDPNDAGAPSITRPPEHYYGDRALMGPRVRLFRRDDLLQQFWAEGIAAQPVLAPGENWTHPQVLASGQLQVAPDGSTYVGSPFRFTVSPPPVDGTSREMIGSDGAPLAGLRVIDFGTFTAGPFASKLLADLGADVIKIESTTGQPQAVTFRNDLASNGRKRRIQVDAKSPEGLDLIYRLCEGADAVHHNFRVGVAERLGLDADTLRERRPDLVYLQSTAFGREGPKAKDSGFEMVVAAWMGQEVRTGGAGNRPAWYRLPLMDFLAGSLGAAAILAALYERERTGAVVTAEVSLMSAMLFTLSDLVRTVDGEFVGAPVLDAQRRGVSPYEALYPTSDGWVAISARGADARSRLRALTGAGEDSIEGLRESVAASVSRLSTADALAQLHGAQIWAESCTTDGWRWMREDDELMGSGIVGRYEHHAYGEVVACIGDFVTVAPAEATTGSPAERQALTELGESTDEVLRMLGIADAATQDLKDRGIVR